MSEVKNKGADESKWELVECLNCGKRFNAYIKRKRSCTSCHLDVHFKKRTLKSSGGDDENRPFVG